MQWLFGQGSRPAVIRSQNPDLNRLVDVLGSERSIAMLVSTNSLAQAFELVEDKAMRLVAFYTGEAEDLGTANQLVRSTRLLRDSMQRIADGDRPLDADQ